MSTGQWNRKVRDGRSSRTPHPSIALCVVCVKGTTLHLHTSSDPLILESQSSVTWEQIHTSARSLSVMEWLFGRKKTPEELLRQNQRVLNKAIRELDRERTKMEGQVSSKPFVCMSH